MKYLNQLLTLSAAVLLLTSCKKDEVETSPLTSINIVNAVAGGTTAKLGTNATNISNNGNAQMAVIAGENNLYVWPVADSAHPYYTNPKFVSQDREVYSLFLTGTPTAPDAILVKENIPYRTDSTAGIRFINLAPNTDGKPLFITTAASPTTVEADNLAYKQMTDFKSYPGLFNSTYTFEIRNDTCASPKPPLATYAFSASAVPRFANVTLVIRENGTKVSVYKVTNDR
jgi:hypothetical protein